MNDQEVVDRFKQLFFNAWKSKRVDWLGVPIVKYPTDLFVYQMLLSKHKPEVLIETGAYWGGSALFFASIFDLLGQGEVISVDIKDRVRPIHPRITYVIGRSTSLDTLETVAKLINGKTCSVNLDSDHRARHVRRELSRYSKFVTPGQYLIVEDTSQYHTPMVEEPGPKQAVRWFLKRTKDFEVVPEEDRFILSLNPGGYLKRVR